MPGSRPSHEKRVFRVLSQTLVHEFGHAVVASHLGFSTSAIIVKSPANAETIIGDGLWDITGKLNQNFLQQAARVAVAGVCAEKLLCADCPTAAEIRMTLSRKRYRHDARTLQAAIERSGDRIEISDVVADVVSVLLTQMRQIRKVALEAATWHKRESPALPFHLPGYFLTNALGQTVPKRLDPCEGRAGGSIYATIRH